MKVEGIDGVIGMAEYGMFAKELALNLDINTNTLRRWAIELEGQGYGFSRNDKNQRIYYQHDILALSDFQKIIEKTQSLEITAKAVVSKVNDKKNAEMMLGVIEESKDKIVFSKEELDDLINRVASEAVERAAEHLSKKFLDIIEQRDRKLIHDLTETMEQKQLGVAATLEEERPSLFTRFFKKR
ncbi:DNA-binding protein [Filibacter tadaridae]|uniref:HTH merR-type domain-containing protein n=1 Tax=Filibacter tadaridae TaxID=2483811 RepID=A0A3P5WQ24_9BACL|nr:DNA-binding protein [Filibacter tadaridae]VDC17992.1 hypothetical protein FILTAD_00011 [Filibacter tadaridae]